MQSVGNRIGVTEPFLMRISHGAPMHISERLKGIKTLHDKLQTRAAASGSRMPSDDRTLRVAKRFYVALMLSRLVQVIFQYHLTVKHLFQGDVIFEC